MGKGPVAVLSEEEEGECLTVTCLSFCCKEEEESVAAEVVTAASVAEMEESSMSCCSTGAGIIASPSTASPCSIDRFQ